MSLLLVAVTRYGSNLTRVLSTPTLTNRVGSCQGTKQERVPLIPRSKFLISGSGLDCWSTDQKGRYRVWVFFSSHFGEILYHSQSSFSPNFFFCFLTYWLLWCSLRHFERVIVFQSFSDVLPLSWGVNINLGDCISFGLNDLKNKQDFRVFPLHRTKGPIICRPPFGLSIFWPSFDGRTKV